MQENANANAELRRMRALAAKQGIKVEYVRSSGGVRLVDEARGTFATDHDAPMEFDAAWAFLRQ